MRVLHGRALAVAGVGCLMAAAAGAGLHAPVAVLGATPPAYSLVNVGPYGGEPSIVSDNNGRLYESTPSGGTVTYTSTTHGASWTPVTLADSKSGDDCLATDQSNAVYLCNLAGSPGKAPLQADVWKSTNHGTTWTHGDGPIPQCATSCSAFGVDRDWVAASILPPATDTAHAEVVLMYHDFYGPSQIWVNISHDGGKTFGAAQDVLAAPAITPGAITGTLVAQAYTFCNTVPAGVGIAPPGTPHAGRIYVGWIASDLAQNATGCNISMLQSFHTLWVSYSDDNGSTWTPQQAFDAGVGHDASTPFVGFTLDSQGNPYFGFAINLNATPLCATESTAGTVQGDKSCEYDMYVVWSRDGGKTWDGGGGLINGSAATPYRVNPTTESGTHFFPAIAAGAPGQVAVAYLRTTEILPTDSLGKADPGGCAGPNAPGNPPTFPPECQWNLYAAQSVNLTSSPANATWTTTPLTTTPMHLGDICNLGIACVAPSSNRGLLDFIQEALDPQGCAHIGYADDNSVNKLRVANQTSGCLPGGGPGCHEGDGEGDASDGHGGNAHMRFDKDACEDGQSEFVQESDSNTGDNFQSDHVTSVTFNDALSNVTIIGTGTHNGSPVTFTFVAVNGPAGVGSYSLVLGDGYAVGGTLLNGSIQLQ
jgi:hypothetical protein